MKESATSFSRNKTAIFIIVGIAILIGFPAALIRMGVDYFLMIAPIFLLLYAIIVGAYIGILGATFAKSKGSSPWLWSAIAILLTLVPMVAINMIDPQYTLYGCFIIPILSIPVTLSLIQLTRQKEK